MFVNINNNKKLLLGALIYSHMNFLVSLIY